MMSSTPERSQTPFETPVSGEGAAARAGSNGPQQSISLTLGSDLPAGGRSFPSGLVEMSALHQVQVVPDLTSAAQVMESRKSIRRWRGTNLPTRPGLTWALFLTLILTLLYAGDLSGLYSFEDLSASFPDAFLTNQTGSMLLMSFTLSFVYEETNSALNTLDILFQVLFVVAFVVVVFLLIKAQIYYRLWLGNWILVLFIFLSVVFRTSSSIDNLSPGYVVGPIFLVALFIYVLYAGVVMFLWHHVPNLQRKRGWFLPKTWKHHIFPVPEVTNQLIHQVYRVLGREERIGTGVAAVKIHYSSFIGRWLPRWWRKLTKSVYVVTYSGEVDNEGRPHGLGEWNDTYYHGEVLIGWWEHGAPCGPFHSQEAGSGAGFKQLQIMYFRNRTDDLFKTSKKIEFAPIHCGIMDIECCTAGIFFREYPKVGQYLDIKRSESLSADIQETLNALLPMPESGSLGSVVIQADLLRGMLVSAHSAPHSTDPCTVLVELCDHSGKRLDRTKTKVHNLAMVLAENFSHRPVEDDSEDENEDSQAAVLPLKPEEGDLPLARAVVQPSLTVRGWEQGSFTKNNEALVFLPGFNSATADSMKLLAQLLALGNFPSYLKPFIYSWPAGDLMGFAGAQTHGAEANQTSQDLKAFLIALGETGIKNIHFLTHSMGIRVLTAALPTLEEIFVPANPLAPSNCKDGPERALHLSTVLLLNTEIGRHEFVDCYARRLTDMCGCISIYADGSDVALIGSELCNSLLALVWPNRRSPKVMEDLSKAPMKKQLARQNSKWEYSLGRIKKDLLYADGQLVDVDIIQTTHLGANVQSVRHSAWSLNRELVDDLRDTIVNKQRAFQRSSRLQYRGGNRYNFLVAPTHVVNP
mmetsp:Transcript_11242/g.31889  ORF Transcript_11242/g.31889 Transcript_11242/m.31889 type:complete len:864 (+) Transcript_11242:160-2751(+)